MSDNNNDIMKLGLDAQQLRQEAIRVVNALGRINDATAQTVASFKMSESQMAQYNTTASKTATTVMQLARATESRASAAEREVRAMAKAIALQNRYSDGVARFLANSALGKSGMRVIPRATTDATTIAALSQQQRMAASWSDKYNKTQGDGLRLNPLPRTSTINTADAAAEAAASRAARASQASSRAAQAAADKMAKSIANAEKAQAALNKKTNEFHMSWRSIGRLVGVQMLHKAVYALVGQIQEGIRYSIELQKSISEIQTIQGNKPLSFETWMGGSREMSDKWGSDMLKQTEGIYQTLSNQITKGFGAIDFMNEANALAVTTVSAVDVAVKALTGTMNAYGMSVGQTREVSAKFFKTVELGRVRLIEMEDLGRVAGLANKLNISFEELLASISMMTRRGIPATTQMTLMRNIVMKLIKPTKEMSNVLRELGVRTGEEAIAIYGLAGFMSELEERTKGSTTELGQLWGRVRSMTGAALFDKAGIKDFVKDLDQIQNSMASFEVGQKRVMETTGKQLEIELTKIKNFFREGIASSFISWTDKANNGVLSLSDSVIGVSQVMITMVPMALIYELGLLATKLRSVNAAMMLIKTSSGVAGGVIAGAFVLAAYAMRQLVFEAEITRDRMIKAYDALSKASMNYRKDTIRELNRVTEVIKEHQREAQKVALEANAKNRALYTRHFDDRIKVEEGIRDRVKEIIGEITDAQRDHISTLQSEYGKLISGIEQASSRIIGIQRGAAEKLFDISLDDKGYQAQLGMMMAQANAMYHEAQKARDAGDYEGMNYYIDQMTSVYDKVISIQKRAKEELQSLREKQRKEDADYSDAMNEIHRKLTDDKDKLTEGQVRDLESKRARATEEHTLKVREMAKEEKRITIEKSKQRSFESDIERIKEKQIRLLEQTKAKQEADKKVKEEELATAKKELADAIIRVSRWEKFDPDSIGEATAEKVTEVFDNYVETLDALVGYIRQYKPDMDTAPFDESKGNMAAAAEAQRQVIASDAKGTEITDDFNKKNEALTKANDAAVRAQDTVTQSLAVITKAMTQWSALGDQNYNTWTSALSYGTMQKDRGKAADAFSAVHAFNINPEMQKNTEAFTAALVTAREQLLRLAKETSDDESRGMFKQGAMAADVLINNKGAVNKAIRDVQVLGAEARANTPDFPVRKPTAEENKFFAANPKTAGMADPTTDSIVMNPNNRLSSDELASVLWNEAGRLLMAKGGLTPSFDITPEQRKAFAGYSDDDQMIRETIASRVMTGDPSVQSPTEEQHAFAQKLMQAVWAEYASAQVPTFEQRSLTEKTQTAQQARATIIEALKVGMSVSQGDLKNNSSIYRPESLKEAQGVLATALSTMSGNGDGKYLDTELKNASKALERIAAALLDPDMQAKLLGGSDAIGFSDDERQNARGATRFVDLQLSIEALNKTIQNRGTGPIEGTTGPKNGSGAGADGQPLSSIDVGDINIYISNPVEKIDGSVLVSQIKTAIRQGSLS